MKLVIGLGNPGEKYKNNRHNVGFMVVDRLAKELAITNWEESKSGKAEYAWGEIGQERIELYKPQTFMNESGLSVGYAKKKHQNLEVSDIYVVHDDLDISLGEYKVQLGRGPKDHGGLNSIEAALKSSDYWHVRIGVDARDATNRTPGEEYVLQNFKEEERKNLDGVIREATKDLINKIMA